MWFSHWVADWSFWASNGPPSEHELLPAACGLSCSGVWASAAGAVLTACGLWGPWFLCWRGYGKALARPRLQATEVPVWDLWLQQPLLSELPPVPLTPVSVGKGRRFRSLGNTLLVSLQTKLNICSLKRRKTQRNSMVYHIKYWTGDS